MSEEELRDRMRKSALICHCADGFYFIDALPDIPLEKQAKDNGECNAHIEFITTVFQEPLWERGPWWPETVGDEAVKGE